MQIVLSMTESGFKARFSSITRLLAVALLSLAAVSTFPANAFAAAGQLDKTFGNGGIFVAPNANFSDSSATSLAIQSDGKIVVAGQAMTSIQLQPAVIRVNANGSLDTSFGNGGLATINLREGGQQLATGVIIQSDGKIVIGVSTGNADGAPAIELVRFNVNGSVDTSFGNAGIVALVRPGPDTTYLLQQPDGKLLLGGGLLMARVDAEGNLDPTFGQDGIAPLVAPASAIALQSDGQIIAVTNGNPGAGSTPSDGGMVRYNANGSLDFTFGTLGRTASIVGTTAAALQGNGDIVAVGPIISKSFVAANAVNFATGFGVAGYNSNGSIDTAFGLHGAVLTGFGTATPFAVPTSLAIERNGDVIVVGQAAQSLPPSSFALARYTPTGALDPTFGSSGEVVTAFGANAAAITAVALDSAGRLVAVGTVRDVGVFPITTSIVVARYLTQ